MLPLPPSAGVPKETWANECRVSVTPAGVATLLKEGFRAVYVQRGAGAAAEFSVSGCCVLQRIS